MRIYRPVQHLYVPIPLPQTVLLLFGVNEKCVPGTQKKHLDRIADYDCVLLQMEIPHETVYKVIRAANEYGTIVILILPCTQVYSDDVFLK